ncbi:MAG: hypothetical protein LPK45_01215 [Bacteroidota bacterium]|nr:hypothetical protein [Bacteroidota bacterium]MDX5429651.1 hypothetical protein [Bacteroidota bacterium]MDX5468432.1 hypothetical protein [Bacteroidota bacterium]
MRVVIFTDTFQNQALNKLYCFYDACFLNIGLGVQDVWMRFESFWVVVVARNGSLLKGLN